jgi:dipeptidyl aminopeptidase/acylaminoacyl peptidase
MIVRLLLAALSAAIVTEAAQARPEPVPVEVWADQDNVISVDMNPSAERMAMLMRRERGGEFELLLFETADIAGTMTAIQTGELRPRRLFWANDRYLVVQFVADATLGSEAVQVARIASFDVIDQRWQSMIRMGRGDPRDPMSRLAASFGPAFIASSLPDDPDHILIGHGEEMGDNPNYYRTNVATGARDLVLRGQDRFAGLIFDREGEARAAQEYDVGRNRIVTYARLSPEDDWREVGALDAENRDRFELLGFFDAARPNMATVYSDTEGENTTGIYELDILTGARDLVFRSPDFDAVDVIRSPRASDGSRVIGYEYADLEGTKPYFIDEEFGGLHAALSDAFPERQVFILRISEDGATILFYVTGPQEPGTWYMLRNGAAARIISRSTEFSADALSPTRLFTYTARDGRAMSGLLTTPRGMSGPFPTIAIPHGGPWIRDEVGYDEWAQMLANQGYAVFQPNYRGSTWLGQEHWIAGDNEWGLAMQDDVDDGMLALAEAGIADPERFAFFGWSYGGYSAFAAATEEQPLYNCMVAGAGIVDLSRIRGGLTGSPFARVFQRPTISGVSPIDHVERVSRPMLIVHGDEDRIVPVEHSRRFADRLERQGANFAYIEIEGMRHSPIEYDQNMQWYPALLEFFDTECGF